MKRLGVYGGTFDPIHIGHLEVIAGAYRCLNLDTLLVVVANQPWMKTDSREITPPEYRYEMTVRSVRELKNTHYDLTGVEVSSIEIDKGTVSYTSDTIEDLRKAYLGCEIFLIIGQDIVGELHAWKNTDYLQQEVTLVVVTRPGSYTRSEVPDGWKLFELGLSTPDISSREVRDKIAKGESVESLVPIQAIRVINREGLYHIKR